MTTTFLIGTFCLLMFYTFTSIENSNASKTVHVNDYSILEFILDKHPRNMIFHSEQETYDIIFHSAAAILILTSSVYMVVKIQDFNPFKNEDFFKAHITAGVISIHLNLEFGGELPIGIFFYFTFSRLTGSWYTQCYAVYWKCCLCPNYMWYHLNYMWIRKTFENEYLLYLVHNSSNDKKKLCLS